MTNSAKPTFYRPELDMLRFFAFLMVFVFHAMPNTSGWLEAVRTACALGVFLFFLLSAYLITELLGLEKTVAGKIHLGRFYARRVLRIWPLYLTMVFVDFGLQAYAHPGAFKVGRLYSLLFLYGNLYVARYGILYSMSFPLWSISVEEQFYLVWPNLWKYLGRRAILAVSLVTLAGSFVALWILCRQKAAGDAMVYFNSFVLFQFFAIGAILAIVLKRRAPALPWTARAALFAVGVAMLFLNPYFPGQDFHAVHHFAHMAFGYVAIDVGSAIIFMSFLGLSRGECPRPFVRLGKISYGLYVFHPVALMVSGLPLWPVIGAHPQLATLGYLLRALVGLGLTVGLASISYRVLESPILRIKSRLETVRTKSV